MNTQNDQNPKNDDSSDCLSASELVRRHLKDKDHEISDSDLQKVALDCNDETTYNNTSDVQVPDATSISMNSNVEDKDDNKKDDDKEEKDILPTPLDILS
jgi:hypothetical protein